MKLLALCFLTITSLFSLSALADVHTPWVGEYPRKQVVGGEIFNRKWDSCEGIGDGVECLIESIVVLCTDEGANIEEAKLPIVCKSFHFAKLVTHVAKNTVEVELAPTEYTLAQLDALEVSSHQHKLNRFMRSVDNVMDTRLTDPMKFYINYIRAESVKVRLDQNNYLELKAELLK